MGQFTGLHSGERTSQRGTFTSRSWGGLVSGPGAALKQQRLLSPCNWPTALGGLVGLLNGLIGLQRGSLLENGGVLARRCVIWTPESSRTGSDTRKWQPLWSLSWTLHPANPAVPASFCPPPLVCTSLSTRSSGCSSRWTSCSSSSCKWPHILGVPSFISQKRDPS